MSVYVCSLLILLYIAMCVTARGYKPMLLDLAESGPCKNDSAFGSFDLSDVPQFGAMCSLPTPSTEQYDVLLENNVVPILCMGVFDVFQRLCQTSSTPRIFDDAKDNSPLTSDQFSELFNTLNKSDKFSSLDTFCLSTVLNGTISESSSNISQFWWNKLNTLFTAESSCKRVCRTTEDNKVHPLCSFIIWSNQVILRNLSRPMPSQTIHTSVGQTKGEQNVESAKIDQSKAVETETNQIFGLPVIDMEESLKPSTPQTEKLPEHIQYIERKSESEMANKSTHPEGVPNISGNQVEPKSNQQIPDVIKQENSTNNSSSVETKPQITKVNETNPLDNKQNDKSNQEKVAVPENQLDQQSVVEEKKSASNKVTDESKVNGAKVDKEGKEEAKVGEEKTDVEVPDQDMGLDVVPEESEIEQPISDKDIPQTSFNGEEIEDGDGDDIETEVELSKMDAVSNQTVPSNGKPGVSAVDTGVEEPDKAYGEVREILIEDHFIEAEDSHFFTYFLCGAVLTIMAYLAFHNKKKLLALALEGRRTRGSRRRPNSSNYSKLDCNLEEALVSNKSASVTHVLY